MSLSSAPLNHWPSGRLPQKFCRRCFEPFEPKTRSDKYCQRRPCQDEKRRRGHEGKGRDATA